MNESGGRFLARIAGDDDFIEELGPATNESMKMTKNSDGSYSYTFTPSQLFDDTGIETIGVLAKAKNGSGDKKTTDYIFEVGVFSLLR